MAQRPRNPQAPAKSASSAGRSLGITLVGIAALMAIVVSVAAYHIVSGNHSRSYLLSEGPFLFESPLTWYRSRDG